MAQKLTTEHESKRGEFFFLNPKDIIVNPENRGRYKPATPEELCNLADSLREYKQLEPVVCRKDEKGRPVLKAGYNRTEAALLIVNGYESTYPTPGKYKDPEFKLRAIIIDSNEEESFVQNVVENAHRKETTPMDDAVNQQRLREVYGKKDTEIAALYRYPDASRVSRLKKLLTLDKKTQNLIADRKLTLQGALDLAELPEAERGEALAEALAGDENGKADSGAIRKKARAKRQEEGGEEGASKPLSASEIRGFFEAIAENAEEQYEENYVAFAKSTLKFLKGINGVTAMLNGMKKFAGDK